MLAAFVGGCGNFCLVGVANNGNGTVGVSAGNNVLEKLFTLPPKPITIYVRLTACMLMP